MQTTYKRILERAELASCKKPEPPTYRRRFLAKKMPAYRFPVEEGIERMLRALRSRLGPDAVKLD
jgi:hypothetical protein